MKPVYPPFNFVERGDIIRNFQTHIEDRLANKTCKKFKSCLELSKVITVPADGLAPLGAKPSAVTVMT